MINLNLKHMLAACAVVGVLLAVPASGKDHNTPANNGHAVPANGAGHNKSTDHGRFPLYDNFNTKRLDSRKWFGEQRSTGGPGGPELVRRANRKGQLYMRHRVSGGDESDTGRHISRNRLLIADDAPIKGIQFDARVENLTLVACESPGASKAVAKSRGAMYLFNDGTSTGPGDARGDVGAVIEITHDTESRLQRHEYSVRGFIFRCESKGCGSSSILDSVDLGTVRRRETVKLGMEWQEDINVVSFWKNNQERNEQTLAYDYIHESDSILRNNRLEIRVEGANCTDGESYAEMAARFDNVELKR